MTNKLKYLIISVFAGATLIYGSILYYPTLHYLVDYLHSMLIDTTESLIPYPGTRTLVKNPGYRKYLKTYSQLPRGMVNAGNFLIYRTQEPTDMEELAPELIPYTDYIRESRLRNEIRKYNGLKSSELPKGAVVIIPNSAPSLVAETRNHAKPDLIATRGLYFTGTAAGSAALLENLAEFKKYGINTIVFDAKDVDGVISYYSKVREVREYDTHEKRTIGNMQKFIRMLKSNNFYTVARIAVFHDHLLRKKAPGLAVRSRKTGGAWNPGSKEKWCDPTSRKVQDYNINIALELIDLGVDEIQFDYIRFPTTGDLSDADYRYDFGKMTNEESITRFLKRAHGAISAHNARLSIDIFGVVAWGKSVDINSTGQRIELLARYCDIISPMLYPSHFNDDFDGYKRPGDNPYYFIYNGCRKVEALAGKRVVIRPWLQAFRWHVSNYNPDYILKQVQACSDARTRGYLFWNASNEYGTVLHAMDRIRSGQTVKNTKEN